MLVETISLIIASAFIWVIGNLVEDKQLRKVILYTSGALLVVALMVMIQHGYNTIVLPNMLQYEMENQIKVI